MWGVGAGQDAWRGCSIWARCCRVQTQLLCSEALLACFVAECLGAAKQAHGLIQYRRPPRAARAAAPPSPRRAGGPYTGASLNPARTIGPAAVFACNGAVSVLYIAAEFVGAALAAGLAIFMYGRNPVGRAAPNRG